MSEALTLQDLLDARNGMRAAEFRLPPMPHIGEWVTIGGKRAFRVMVSETLAPGTLVMRTSRDRVTLYNVGLSESDE